jgi:peptide/nickel transport system substrate-binding protein
VQFTLSKPYAPFLGNTTLGILPARLWQGISDEEFAFTNLAAEPVGAGPFKVNSVSRDSSGLITSYTVVANPRYVLGRPYLDSITLRFYAQQQDLMKALAAGNVDSAYGFPAANAYSTTLRSPYSRVFGVFFNGANNAALARLEVRKALSLAIDRDAIVNQVLGGYATAIMGPVPPGSGITEVAVPVSSDPAADASAVLTAAGWKYDANGRAWTYGSGKTALSLSSITIKTSDVPELKGVASAVKADWEKLGIATDVELYEPGDLSQNVIRPRKYDALLFGEVIGRDLDLYPFWHSSQRTDPGLNIVGYADKDVDALLADARQTSDRNVRMNDLSKIESSVAAAYPAAFVESPNFIYAVPKGLTGVSLPQITTPADRFASVANWYLHTEDVWPFLAKTSRSIN